MAGASLHVREKWRRGIKKSLLAQEGTRGWGQWGEVWGGSPGPPVRDTSRGHLPAEGRRGEGRRSPPGAPRSGPPRLREHAAGQARADVIGSAPRAPGRAGEGGHRAGRERGRAGVPPRRWPGGDQGSPRQSTPKLFSNSWRGPKRSSGSDSKPPLSRPRPAPSTLSALPRSKVRAPPLPTGLRLPPPLPGLPVRPGPAARSKLQPPAAAQAQPPRPPPPAPALRWSAQIVRAVTLVGGQGPRGR